MRAALKTSFTGIAALALGALLAAPAKAQIGRLAGEFFAVQSGMTSEAHAVLFKLPDSEPTGWEPEFGPPRGGVGW